jgi:hypothetical protein
MWPAAPLPAAALVTILCGLLYLASLTSLPLALESRGFPYLAIHWVIRAWRFGAASAIVALSAPVALRAPPGVRSLCGYLDAVRLARIRPLGLSLVPAFLTAALQSSASSRWFSSPPRRPSSRPGSWCAEGRGAPADDAAHGRRPTRIPRRSSSEA